MDLHFVEMKDFKYASRKILQPVIAVESFGHVWLPQTGGDNR